MGAEKCIEFIGSMSKADFFHKVLRGAAKTHEFACAATFGAESLTEEEREAIVRALKDAGVPAGGLSPEELSRVVNVITARAVTVS